MNLMDAIASGKKFRRESMGGNFLSYEEYVDNLGLEKEDVLAVDYEVEPDAPAVLTKATFDAAWNAARAGHTSVKAAGGSDFYKKLVNQLGLR